MRPDDAKRKLIDAGRVLEAEGHADMTRGHISVRVPGQPGLFFMKPHSYGFDEMTMDNIVTCNLEGEKVAGSARRHSEVFIHSEIFRARPDVTSVIHSHPPYSVAVSATGRPVRAVSQPGAFFAGGVPIYEDTIVLIRSQELGRGVAECLGRHPAVLLKSHGVVTAGTTIEEAVYIALMLENACKIQILAESTGHTAPEFPREQVLELERQMASPEQGVLNFEYLVRKARRRG